MVVAQRSLLLNEAGNINTVNTMLKYKSDIIDINWKNDNGFTALMKA